MKEKQSLVSIMAVLLMLGGILFLFIFPDCDYPKIILFASIWKVWFFGLWVNPDVKIQTRTNWPRKVRELILDSVPWSQGVKGWA